MQKADQLRAEIASITDLLKKGRPERALKRASKAAKKWPKVAALPRLAGLCAVQQQNPKLAQPYFEQALKLDPGNPELIQNYGLSLVQAGDAEAASRFIAKIASKGPLTPTQHYIHAMALLRERRLDKALGAVDQVTQHEPRNLAAVCLKADILDEMHRWDDAIAVLQDLVVQHPRFPYGQLRLAKGLSGLGRIDEALEHARAALKLAPTHAETLHFMTTLPNLTPDDAAALRTRVDTAVANLPTNNSQEDAVVHFAGAKLAFLDKDTAQEMEHLTKAHLLMANGLEKMENDKAKEARKLLAAPLPAKTEGANPKIPRPIFVVGLPRSGTTLVERILSSHSGVHGFGELATVQHWVRKNKVDAADKWDMGDLADFYVDKLPGYDVEPVAFVDKMPGNYAYLGAIAQAFPNAIILNVRRDPRDIALSMWREYFGARGMYFSHNFKWMAAEANRYQRYMQHWHQVLPGRIHDIGYEELVSNFPDAVRSLAQLCDLEFEEDMLTPQKTQDAVRTASSLQVRKPVSTSSVGRWKAVEDHLAPFIKSLDTTLWPDLEPKT